MWMDRNVWKCEWIRMLGNVPDTQPFWQPEESGSISCDNFLCHIAKLDVLSRWENHRLTKQTFVNDVLLSLKMILYPGHKDVIFCLYAPCIQYVVLYICTVHPVSTFYCNQQCTFYISYCNNIYSTVTATCCNIILYYNINTVKMKNIHCAL